MRKKEAGMRSQEAVPQTEGTTSAKVLRKEGSQRGWNKITSINGDAKHQEPDCVDIMFVYPLQRRPQALRIRVEAEESNPDAPSRKERSSRRDRQLRQHKDSVGSQN